MKHKRPYSYDPKDCDCGNSREILAKGHIIYESFEKTPGGSLKRKEAIDMYPKLMHLDGVFFCPFCNASLGYLLIMIVDKSTEEDPSLFGFRRRSGLVF